MQAGRKGPPRPDSPRPSRPPPTPRISGELPKVSRQAGEGNKVPRASGEVLIGARRDDAPRVSGFVPRPAPSSVPPPAVSAPATPTVVPPSSPSQRPLPSTMPPGPAAKKPSPQRPSRVPTSRPPSRAPLALRVPKAPQVPTIEAVELDDGEIEMMPPRSLPPTLRKDRPLAGSVRSTLISPDEVVAYVRESAPPSSLPPPALAAPSSEPPSAGARERKITISDPLDIVFGMTHELAFQEDSLEGAAFAVRALRAFVPSRAILFHLYDAERNAFVIATLDGAFDPSALIAHRTPLTDPLVQATLDDRTTKVFLRDAQSGWVRERHETCGAKESVLAQPVRRGARQFGLIEVVDPALEVDERITDALSYLAERLAEFFAEHPVVMPVAIPLESGLLDRTP